MKWTVLVDNRTNDPTLETEHGLSVFLETERHPKRVKFSHLTDFQLLHVANVTISPRFA